MTTAPIAFHDGLPHLATTRRTLPCGLDVIVHADDSAPQVCVSVWYRVGSSDERADRTGFAHLFEHLFKSTPDRTGGQHHYELLKRAGSTEANASTGADRTAYHEVLPAHQLALALWLESDRMGYYLPMPEERLTTQQSVVRAERRQRYEDVPYGAERFAPRSRCIPRPPARHPTIGRHDDIQAATLEDVAAFYRTWYVPANATLVVTGDDDVDALVDATSATSRPRRDPLAARPSRSPARARSTVDIASRRCRDPSRMHAPAAFSSTRPARHPDLGGSAVGTGALWRRLVYETTRTTRVRVPRTRLGGEVHVAVDPHRRRSAAARDPRRRTARADERSIERRHAPRSARDLVAHRHAKRTQMLQAAMYTADPDGRCRVVAIPRRHD
jgi:hypothetical protein